MPPSGRDSPLKLPCFREVCHINWLESLVCLDYGEKLLQDKHEHQLLSVMVPLSMCHWHQACAASRGARIGCTLVHGEGTWIACLFAANPTPCTGSGTQAVTAAGLGSQLPGLQTWPSTHTVLTSAVQIVLGPHVYGPSVTGAIYGYNGYWLWWRMSRSFGRKTTQGDAIAQ